jgi:hypothetical protein
MFGAEICVQRVHVSERALSHRPYHWAYGQHVVHIGGNDDAARRGMVVKSASLMRGSRHEAG